MRAVIAGREFVCCPVTNRDIRSTNWWIPTVPDGWIGIPSPRFESEPIPFQQGGYSPESHLYSPRVMSTLLAVKGANGSLGRAHAEDWVSTLIGTFPFMFEDENGPRELLGVHQSATPNYQYVSSRYAEFTIITTAPDPIKYGQPVMYSDDGFAENSGAVSVLPISVNFDGYVTAGAGFTLELRDASGAWRRVRWINPEWYPLTYVELNLRSMSATALGPGGVREDVTVGIIEDDIIRLQPGLTEYRLSIQDAFPDYLYMEVRPGWL